MLTTNPVMTSIELVEFINESRRAEARADGESSRLVVELRHDNFMVKIESHPGIDAPKFLGTQKYGNGNTRRIYNLPKRECELMVMSESPAVQAKVYDRMVELERAAAPAPIDLNDPAALRSLLLGYSEKVLSLEAKVSADAPKVEFAETIRNMDAVCHIGEVAKMIGIGPNKLFKRLREDKVLMKNNIPYQCYIDRDYFTLIEGRPYFDKKGASHPTFTPMVTGAGQVYLQRKYQPITGAT